MNSKNRIGLDSNKSELLAGQLNELLANYSIFYQNTRGYHWNIKGDKFFILHAQFEALYTDLFQKIDEIAERILTLGHAPEHRFSQYSKISEIKEGLEVREASACVKGILGSFEILIRKQRALLELAAEADDEGTSAMMSDYIREQEKSVWMYSAFLND